MNLNNKKNIAIISHFSFKDKEEGAVFPQNIRNYLIKRNTKVRYIDHPFPDGNFPSSQLRIYEQGSKSFELTSPGIKLPILILFIYQFFLNFSFLVIRPERYDLCIACDNLSFISAWLLRKIGMIKKIVYYTVDYSPKRYSNPILNSLYQNLDRLASRWSDLNWVAVEDMIKAKEQNGLSLRKSAPFQVVPIGFDKIEIDAKSINKLSRFRLVFVGLLIEKQGVQLVIKALPQLIKKFPMITFTIIGSGIFEKQIKRMVNEEKLSSYVEFTGYISNHKEIIKILMRSGVGLALYDPSIGDYTYFADPSKIKLYLMCGLPVITSKVPPIAKKVMKRNAGFMIDYSEKELIDKLGYLLKDGIYSKFRENAKKLGSDFDINLILSKAFKKLPE